MKVQVVKANRSTYWYANKIGEIFEVEWFDSGSYVVKAPAPYDKGFYIDIEDAKEVEKSMDRYRVSFINLPIGINRKTAHINAVRKAVEMGYTDTYNTINRDFGELYMVLCGDGDIVFGGLGDTYTYLCIFPKDGGLYMDISYDEFMKLSDKKTINCKIDLSWIKGQAREVISEAIQKKLFEADARWYNGNTTACDKEGAYLIIIDGTIFYTNEKAKFDGKRDGNHVPKETVLKIPEVSVNNALKGDFWTYSVYAKKEEAPKLEGYKVSLAAYTGKYREVVSKAVQEEAFKKGYGWYGVKLAKNTQYAYLYFRFPNGNIGWDSDAAFFQNHDFKELTVEEILSGILPSVK